MTATARGGPVSETAPQWPLGRLHTEADEFVLSVGDELCGAGGWLFGGWALGLLSDAVQQASNRTLQDLSVSFLRPVAYGQRLRVRCVLLAEGRALSHYRVEALDDGGQTMLSGMAVVGPAPSASEQSAAPPRAASPEECPERPYLVAPGTGVATLLDVRVAQERLTDGVASTMLLWGRLRCDVPEAVRVAVLSDHVPYLLRRSLPALNRASTVSSTLRIAGLAPTEWVLFDVSLSAVGQRTALGRSTLWSADGRLLALAEQTARLSWTEPRRETEEGR